MANIILSRDAQRLNQMAIARIWGPVLFKQAEKSMAIIKDCLLEMAKSIALAMAANEKLIKKLNQIRTGSRRHRP